MKKFLKKKLGNEKGMTLIELLAVIVILAIIAAIAIPAIGSIIDNSRYGASKSDIQNAFASANLYKAQDGVAPASLSDLEPFMESKGTIQALTISENATTDKIEMLGEVEINDIVYTFTKIDSQTLSEQSVKEFKAILTEK
ncbi:prepilin-type N-terminal cleavage/methylation domain-containing protein [Planomicrobium okeanokoites]|uniref:prepilin-type N-terminal cleavage/methylation domain-containing protein n=1 Tax=Planomicrobium okeanokoites TaxID=244 RepID=UPI0030F88468